jgi:hypothetical protein
MMIRKRPTTYLALATLALLPFAAAHAVDQYKPPTRPDDPVDPIPQQPQYAGWGYVCSINAQSPHRVSVALQTSVDCANDNEIYIKLCTEAGLDVSHCPLSSDPDYAESVYSNERLAMTVALLRDAMNHRYVVRAYRNEIYGYDPAFNGTDHPLQYAHKASVGM